MFPFEVRPGIFRLAVCIYRTEAQAEIVVFLSAQDAPICDVSGELSRTPRLYVRNDLLPEAGTIPSGYNATD